MRKEAVATLYEAVDHTNDEMYFTLGLFTELDEAIERVKGSTPNLLDEFGNSEGGFYTVEIHARRIGWSRIGRKMFSCTWNEFYNEDADEYQWKIVEESLIES